jgi:methyl-accepting chemotaxis protein
MGMSTQKFAAAARQPTSPGGAPEDRVAELEQRLAETEVTVHQETSPVYIRKIEELIDRLIEGKYDDIQEGHDTCTRKINKLAAMCAERALNDLRHAVEMSVTANNGVTCMAETTRTVREVDNRTQSMAAAVEELAASVNSISENSESAAEEAKYAASSAEAGMEAAGHAVDTMAEITRAVEDTAAKVGNLSKASAQIGQIIQEIEAIAKQTNLLALNATIEAARAGQAGKGFAVVANEVKGLASQSAKAADLIRARIDWLGGEMEGIVGAMHQGAEKVRVGQEVIASTGNEMRRVSNQIHTVTSKMQDITQILNQQTLVSKEISDNISAVAIMSAENVNGIESTIELLEQTEGPIVSFINGIMQLDLPYATIYAARSDHMIWMRKLAQMLAGRTSLDPQELADHHSCRLGKWYDSQTDPKLTTNRAWQALKVPHRRVHAAGIRAATCYKNKDLDGAIANVREAGIASKDVMRLLDELAEALT